MRLYIQSVDRLGGRISGGPRKRCRSEALDAKCLRSRYCVHPNILTSSQISLSGPQTKISSRNARIVAHDRAAALASKRETPVRPAVCYRSLRLWPENAIYLQGVGWNAKLVERLSSQGSRSRQKHLRGRFLLPPCVKAERLIAARQ